MKQTKEEPEVLQQVEQTFKTQPVIQPEDQKTLTPKIIAITALITIPIISALLITQGTIPTRLIIPAAIIALIIPLAKAKAKSNDQKFWNKMSLRRANFAAFKDPSVTEKIAKWLDSEEIYSSAYNVNEINDNPHKTLTQLRAEKLRESVTTYIQVGEIKPETVGWAERPYYKTGEKEWKGETTGKLFNTFKIERTDPEHLKITVKLVQLP